MALNFENLDARTRELMLSEIDRDVADPQGLYQSAVLTAAGLGSWEALLRQACETGNDSSLAVALGDPGGSYIMARRPDPSTRTGDRKVSSIAATTLAEGEFNRYYMRALCLRAIQEELELEIYRARFSAEPELKSEAMIGTSPDPESFLADLRSHQGREPALGLPHPNSGLSVRLRI